MSILPIYVISLSQDYESRYLPMIERLNSLQVCPTMPIRTQRIDAVYGKTLRPEERQQYCNNPWLRMLMTPSMLGCAASHFNTWGILLEQDEPWALVVEDDVVFEPDSIIRISRILSAASDHADIITLGCTHPSVFKAVNQNSHCLIPSYMRLPSISSDVISDAHFFFTTSSYLISRYGAARLRACMGGRLCYHIDLMIHGACHKGVCRVATLQDPVASTDLGLASHNNAGFPWIVRVIPSTASHILNQPLLQLGVLRVSVAIILFLMIILFLIPRKGLLIIAVWMIAEMRLSKSIAWPTIGIIMCLSIYMEPRMRRWWLIVWIILTIYIACHWHWVLLGRFIK